jgi:hypothetical protein
VSISLALVVSAIAVGWGLTGGILDYRRGHPISLISVAALAVLPFLSMKLSHYLARKRFLRKTRARTHQYQPR